MLFNSVSFVAFFLVVLTVHTLPLPVLARKFNLLFASYVFYAAWDVRFTLLLIFVTFVNGLAAKMIAKWDHLPAHRRFALWSAVVLNVALLCTFKYGNELLSFLRWAAEQLHLPHAQGTKSILLPVGLSFFTFQALSYTIDVYRRTIKPAKSLIDIGVFVSFFPVLLAGPLLRAGPFFQQVDHCRRAKGTELGFGASVFVLGLFMKVVLADYFLAPVVSRVFDSGQLPDTFGAWIGTVGFAAQDYCDFAGYSCCAVGLGHCLGFSLPDNFRAPFSSVGFRDLWQRWHITLVAWMRDYVFNSLGGVYMGYRRAVINVFIVFLLLGLWHGATWSYLIFGFLQASYLVVEVLLQRSPLKRLRFWSNPVGIFLLWLTTMVLCMVAFAFYRGADLQQSWAIFLALFGVQPLHPSYKPSDLDLVIVLVIAECLVISHWLCRHVRLDELVLRAPWWAITLCLALMLFAITVTSGESESYLYFHY